MWRPWPQTRGHGGCMFLHSPLKRLTQVPQRAKFKQADVPQSGLEGNTRRHERAVHPVEPHNSQAAMSAPLTGSKFGFRLSHQYTDPPKSPSKDFGKSCCIVPSPPPPEAIFSSPYYDTNDPQVPRLRAVKGLWIAPTVYRHRFSPSLVPRQTSSSPRLRCCRRPYCRGRSGLRN